jgi:transposase
MYYCGIDIAKKKHDAVILDNEGKILGKPMTITNTASGFEELTSTLQSLDQEVFIGLEATGHYWLALYDKLSTADFKIVVLNPLQIAAYRRSGIRKVKNDRKDAWWIADYLRIANLPPTDRQLPILLRLRELTRFRYALMDQVGDLKRKMLSILDRVFPEYETVFSDVFIKSSRALLKEVVSAQEIAAFDLSELTAILKKNSGGRFGQEKASYIQDLARESVGVGFLAEAVYIEMQCLLEQLDLLLNQIALLDSSIEEIMDQIPQFITTIPGVGNVTGSAILAEIGDINRFESSEKLVAYAGIDPTVYETGQFVAKKTHMSKRGSPHLRYALWQAASMAIQYDPELRAYYQTKRAEGKHHGTALGAVCNKLLSRIFIILKEQRPYIVHYENSTNTPSKENI